MLSRVRTGLIFGVLVALLGMFAGSVPALIRFEENAGLALLFQLRGARPAPAEVVVVSLDKVSSDAFGLPNEPQKWPRTLHASLVGRLAAEGAALIAFDVVFDDPGDAAADAALAGAVQAAGNVVLAAFLQKSSLGASRDGQVTVTRERLLPLIGPLADNALAVAPFPLPRVPVRVNQYWTFKETAGNLPTLPAVVFQAWMLAQGGGWLSDLRAACDSVRDGFPATGADILAGRRVTDLLRAARECLAADERAAHGLRTAWMAREQAVPGLPGSALRSLYDLYAGADTRFLNYYGPPRTVRTVPYTQALSGEPTGVAGAIVLVGFSEQFQPEQKDGFYSVFTDDSGLDLSGVEIAATAVANLLDGSPVRPVELGPYLLVMGLWGLLTGTFCRLLPPQSAVVFAVFAIPLYGAWAWWVFDISNNWLPVGVPVLVQLPAALLLGLLAQYRETRRQRERVLQALGAYLPRPAVDRLMQNLGDLKASAELLHGSCLATDAEQYTRLAEALSPEDLAAFLNTYYGLLFAAVEETGGVVTDVVGDAMMAIWASATPDASTRAAACRGALAVAAAADAFNRIPGQARLPTRIGLHSGPIRLGNIGGARHVEFRAVGDIVNTASRIEGLGKTLGTRLLVSAETLEGVPGFITRELGTFLLPGKTTPLVIHELLGERGPDSAPRDAGLVPFAAALRIFRKGNWAEAERQFRACQADRPDDGPARFYVALCAHYLQSGPDSLENGAVRIREK